MAPLRINLRPSSRQLLVFALAWLAIAGLLGFVQWRQDRPVVAGLVWSAGVLGLLLDLLWPAALRLLYVGLSFVTFPIGLAISSLVLAALYYAVLTPIGLILRLGRHDPLRRRLERDAASYWQIRPPPPEPESYFRQH